jgi:PEP-CTERM motif-containing protein
MKKAILTILVATGMAVLAGQTAKADSFSWPLAAGLTATETISSTATTFNITFTITNTSGTNAGIYDFSLGVAPGGTATVTSFTGTGTSATGFEFFDNTKQNNGSGNTCSTNTVGGWVCVDYSTYFDTIAANGGTLTYVFSGTYTGSLDSDPHLMAQGCVNTSDTYTVTTGTGHNKVTTTYNCPFNGAGSYNISLDGTPGQVPEPGSLMLFGTGLLGMAGFLRRKLMS